VGRGACTATRPEPRFSSPATAALSPSSVPALHRRSICVEPRRSDTLRSRAAGEFRRRGHDLGRRDVSPGYLRPVERRGDGVDVQAAASEGRCESGALGAVAGAGLGILSGAASAASPALGVAVKAALVGSGTYSTVQGFQSGQYVLGSVGAVTAAMGLLGLTNELSESTETVPTGTSDVKRRATLAGYDAVSAARRAGFEPAANDFKIQHDWSARAATIEAASWLTGATSGPLHYFGRFVVAPIVTLGGVAYELSTAIGPLNGKGRYFDQQGPIDWLWHTPDDLVANTIGQISAFVPLRESFITSPLRYASQLIPGPDHTFGHVCPSYSCVSHPGGPNALP